MLRSHRVGISGGGSDSIRVGSQRRLFKKIVRRQVRVGVFYLCYDLRVALPGKSLRRLSA